MADPARRGAFLQEVERWDELSDEALENFEKLLEPHEWVEEFPEQEGLYYHCLLSEPYLWFVCRRHNSWWAYHLEWGHWNSVSRLTGEWYGPLSYSEVKDLTKLEPVLEMINEMTPDEIEAEIRQYEEKYGMTTEEMLEADELPDEFGVIDWKILARHREEE